MFEALFHAFMKGTESRRSLDKALLIIISLLLVFIGGVLFLRTLSNPASSELSSVTTSDIGTITTDDFTTVFTLADNASQSVKAYQERLLQNVGTLVIGAIALLCAGALLVYSLITRLKPKRAMFTIAIFGLSLIWVGIAGQNIFKANEVQDVRDCVRLQNVYDSRQYKIVEGPVHVIHQSAGHGHSDNSDIVQVGSQQLEIVYLVSPCAYTKLIVFGGVLTEGIYARIYYTDARTILRIDVKNQ